MTRLRSIALLLFAALLSSCGKDALQNITGTLPGSNIKFFNFGVCNVTAAPATSCMPGVNFYANSQKMTAISSTTGKESTTGTAYGGVGNGGFYSGIAPGPYTLSGKIAAATDNGLALSNITATLEDGKYYSLYQSGFYDATAKTIDGFILDDSFAPQIDFSVAYVRFVNAISNSSPMTLYAKSTVTGTEVPVGAEMAYKGAGAFTALPGAVYDLSARITGSSTNAIAKTAVSLSAGRVYTISARGDMTIVSTTAINRPFLDNTANR